MILNKLQAIKLLTDEGWTKADAERALAAIDFKTNPDELTIRKKISQFAGSELINRQKAQAAQKRQVTLKKNEIEQLKNKYTSQENKQSKSEFTDLEIKNKLLEERIKLLTTDNQELIKVNNELKKDNKALKNLVDQIRLRLAQDMKKLMKYEDSEIRKALAQLFQSTLG